MPSLAWMRSMMIWLVKAVTLDVRMHLLDGVDRSVNRLFARILERRAEAHDDDGVLVRFVLQLRRLVLQHADLCGFLQCWRCILDFRIQRVGSFRSLRCKAKASRKSERGSEHFLPVLHEKFPLKTAKTVKQKYLSPHTERKAESSSLQVPSPSFVGHAVTSEQAVLLAWFIAYPRLPRRALPLPVTFAGNFSRADALPPTVAGPRRLPTGFSFESCDTCPTLCSFEKVHQTRLLYDNRKELSISVNHLSCTRPCHRNHETSRSPRHCHSRPCGDD